jgi:membrane-associated protease RseP (regulator of RpoE activity)
VTPPPDTATLPDPGPVDGAPESPSGTPAEEPRDAGPLGLIALLGALVAIGFLSIPALIVILSLVFMIFMHELGHYITAKRAGMEVTEFFIGFGPRIWSFRRGETEYGIKAIWAGAYVKIIGMNNLEEVDPADESRTYRQKSYPRRLSVAVAGSAMHFAMALVLLFLIFGVVGQSVNESRENTVVGELSDAAPFAADVEASGLEIDDDFAALLDSGETPASAAGLQPGDEILTVDGAEVGVFTDLRPLLEDRGGDTIVLTYVRDDVVRTTDLTVGWISDGENERGFIGVSPNIASERSAPIAAVGDAVSTFADITTESAKALVAFFSPSGLSDFTSLAVNAGDEQTTDAPVSLGSDTSADQGRIISIYGAARIGTQATEEGLAELFWFLALINIFIGVFNLVPLLPLDGGHVAVATYERIREFGRRGRYHADVYKLIPLTYGVIFVLLTVGVLALYADIFDPVV